MKASLKALASDRTSQHECLTLIDRRRSKLTLRVAETDGQGNGLGLTLANIGSSVPDPAAVRANVGRELHLRDD
jgi:uncharacterized protein YlxW (UPF0749 family)